MLSAGPAIKVSIYLSEGSTHQGVSTYLSIIDFLYFRGVSGATAIKGVAGFGADHRLHSSNMLAVSDHLPIKVEFIESREKVDELLGTLQELAGSGLIELQETTIAKPAGPSEDGQSVPVQHKKIEGKAKLMRIYIGEDDRWKDKPLYEALISAMRANDLAGATVYRGILGYGEDRKIHKDSAFHLSHDSSVMISVIDTEEKLQSVLPVLDGMIQQGFVVLSDVDVIKYSPRSQTALDSKE